MGLTKTELQIIEVIEHNVYEQYREESGMLALLPVDHEDGPTSYLMVEVLEGAVYAHANYQYLDTAVDAVDEAVGRATDLAVRIRDMEREFQTAFQT